jgi:hypothetical protein
MAASRPSNGMSSSVIDSGSVDVTFSAGTTLNFWIANDPRGWIFIQDSEGVRKTRAHSQVIAIGATIAGSSTCSDRP